MIHGTAAQRDREGVVVALQAGSAEEGAGRFRRLAEPPEWGRSAEGVDVLFLLLLLLVAAGVAMALLPPPLLDPVRLMGPSVFSRTRRPCTANA